MWASSGGNMKIDKICNYPVILGHEPMAVICGDAELKKTYAIVLGNGGTKKQEIKENELII